MRNQKKNMKPAATLAEAHQDVATRETMPPQVPTPLYTWEWRVLKSAQVTRFVGQIMDGGATRKRRATLPMEKPIWGVQTRQDGIPGGRRREAHHLSGDDEHPLVAKVVDLVVVDALDGDDVRLQGARGETARARGGKWVRTA